MFGLFHWMNRAVFFGEAGRLVRDAKNKVLHEPDMLALPADVHPLSSGLDASRLEWTDGRKLAWSSLPAARSRLVPAYTFFMISAFMGLLQPMLVNRFVGSISAGLGTSEAFRWCLFFAIALGLTAIVRGLTLQHYFFHTLGTYQWLVNALNERLFRHSLRMTPEARLKTPVGDIVNHMGSDSESVADFPLVLADLIYAIVTVVGVIAMLFWYIGWSAILPLVLLATLAPATRWVAKRFARLDETMMHERDRRVTLMGQILNSIRVVKYFAWERSVTAEVGQVRKLEIGARRRMARAEAVSGVTYVAVSSIVLFSALAFHAWRGFTLDPALVFTCVTLFMLLEEPFGGLSWTISRMINAFVGAGRIAKFVATDTLTDREKLSSSAETALTLETGPLAILGGREFRVKAGEAVALVGPVGGGKSTLIAALLGENPADRDRVRFLDASGHRVEPRSAYVPQEAYIINGSLRENLIFGGDGDSEQRLSQAVFAASFEKDLQELPAGLATEIGEKGVNLSGGQKQRVSLARSILRDPQVVFLDDPLSAVDVETEEKLCDRLIFGLWQGRTRIVATHRLGHLRRFDRIFFIDGGRITGEGSYDELLAKSERFRAFVRDHEKAQGGSHKAAAAETITTLSAPVKEESRITDDEEREIGAVKRSVYTDYFKSLGGEGRWRVWNLSFLLIGAITVMSLPLLQRWWLGVTSTLQQGGPMTGFASQLREWGWEAWMRDPLSSIFIYGAIGLVALVLNLCNMLFWTERGIRAGQILHDQMLSSLMKAQIRFFDSTPVGRILQRFSRDVESVDMYLQRSFDQMTHILIEVVLCLALIVAVVPMSIVLIAPVLVIYYVIQRDYRRPAREVKRLDSIARSPRYAHFKETLMGLPVIRGFGREDWFMNSFYEKLAHSQRMFYSHYLLNRWFSARVPLVGGVIAVATAVAIAFAARSGSLNAGIAGVLTIYMLSFWGYLNWGIRVFADIESRMTSVERLRTYARLPAERDVVVARTTELRPSWPERGAIRFDDLNARYAPHLPLVLKGVSFEVGAGQKIGLIGRTGSGKSTLFQCLYRFVEPESGKVLLDGEDIASVPLERLRRSLAIIPQDPTLFLGTIRSNLDRYGEYGEAELIGALKKALLWDFVSSLPGGLDAPVVENGLNFSQGQRQLFCLARALLVKARVIVLDEATASVDVETDALLQQVIRDSLGGITLLIIAHRLGTVSDCDKVVELAGGRVVAELEPRDARIELAKIEEEEV